MHNPEGPAISSIDADSPVPVIYTDYLSDALAAGRTDNIRIALREVHRAMRDEPGKKVCDFDLSLNDVFRVLKDAGLSSPLSN